MLIQNNVLDPDQTAMATAILANAVENPEEASGENIERKQDYEKIDEKQDNKQVAEEI